MNHPSQLAHYGGSGFYAKPVKGGIWTVVSLHFTAVANPVMVWGAVLYDFKSPFTIVTADASSQGFTQKAYERQILRGPLPRIASTHPNHFCVEDNAPCHGKKDTRRNVGLCNKA